MVIIWGTRFVGKVDEVPGMFYVKTRFGHLWWIPLLPIESYVIFEENMDGIRGASIPLSGKSVGMAYLRTAMVVGAIAMGIAAFIGFGAEPLLGFFFGALAVALAGLFIVTKVVKVFTHAGYERAVQLGEYAGLTHEGRLAIEIAFGRMSAEQADAVLGQHYAQQPSENPFDYLNPQQAQGTPGQSFPSMPPQPGYSYAPQQQFGPAPQQAYGDPKHPGFRHPNG